jgi:regulator of nucleoside diphosphate kinase
MSFATYGQGMRATHGRPIVVTQNDFQRLTSLLASGLASRFGKHLEALSRVLARAQVVPPRAIAPNVVTMNSTVVYANETDTPSKVTIVYPWDASPNRGHVSVFAPLGTALLGMREGASIAWTNASGHLHQWTVLSVLFQPEAHGLVHL